MDTQGLFFCVLSHISAASLVSYCLPCIWWFSLKILCYLKDNNILRIWHFHSLPLHHSLFFCVSSDIYILQICIPGSSFQVTFSNFFFSPERNFLWIHNSKVSTSIFSCYCCAVTKLYLFVTPWSAACQASLSLTNSHSLLTHVHWVSDALQPSHPLSPLSVFTFSFPQHQDLFQRVGFLYPMPKYWSFSFSISPSNEYSRLISLRIDWFDLGVKGTLKSLLRHHSLKAWILWHSAFFMVQQQYMTTGKTIALTIQTFVGKVTSLLFNMLSRLVIAFLPRSKCLLISWLQVTVHSGSGAQENKTLSLFPRFPHLPWGDGTGCRDPSFLNAEF